MTEYLFFSIKQFQVTLFLSVLKCCAVMGWDSNLRDLWTSCSLCMKDEHIERKE